MAVCFDDWTLSGLTGTLKWTVVRPTTTSLLDALHTSSSDSLQQAQTYPALFTELTPTVLTGRSSASADAAPLVYATVSSLFDMEKIGPRQLRIQQEQFGVPGSFRLLYLTAPNEVVCDEWWRALHRLTYNQRLHSPSTNASMAALLHPHPTPESANILRDAATSVSNSPVALALERSQEESDVAQLQQLLLFTPSSLCPTTMGRLSYNPRGDTPSPFTVEPPAHASRTPLPLLCRQPPAHEVSRDGTKRHSAAALLLPAILRPHDTAIATAAGADGASSWLSQLDSAAVPADVGLLSMKKEEHSVVPKPSSRCPMAQARGGDHKQPPLAMKSPNTSALATSLPSGNSMSFPPTARRLLDPTSLRDMLRSVPDASSTTASVRTASPSAASINGGAAERVTALPLQTPAQATVAPLKQAEVPVAEAVLALSPKAPRQKLLECNKTTNAASRPAYPVFTTADDAPVRLSYSASTSTTPPARQQPASQGLGVSSRSPPHESSRARLSSPTREGAALPGIQLSSEAAAPAQVSTAARSPLSPSFSAYEPIHVEATTVPRAHGRCCTPPFLRLTSLSSVRQVHLQRLHGCCASLIPRIKYHSVSPLGRHTDASASRSRYPKRLFSSFTAGRSVSPHDNGNALGSSCSGSREQATFLSSARSSCHLGAAEAPAIPPLLAVMAKPHLFVKHPVRVSSRRVSSTGGVCADGVPTYVFVTIDEECVVAVSAARFQRCVETANLLEPHNVLGGGVGVQFDHSGTASLSIAVRSFKRAQQFFGKAHCKGMRVAEVKRVSRGNEEPLLLFNAEQRERFHDLSRIICIAAQTHAFILEAASSAEAKVYVRNWRKYLHSLRGHHIKRPHIGGVENNSASHSHRLGTRARVCNGSRNTFGWTFDGCASRYSS